MTISATAAETSSRVRMQIELVRKMNKFLAAEVLIESAKLGNQLLDLDMLDEGGRRASQKFFRCHLSRRWGAPGQQLLDSSLIAIEQALQPEVLFRGGFGFRAADLPKILASLPGGQKLSFQNTHSGFRHDKPLIAIAGHDPIRRRCLSAISSKVRRLGPDSLLDVVHSLVESKDALHPSPKHPCKGMGGTGMPGQAARGGPRTPPASSADRRQEETHLRRTTAARDPSQISSLQASSIIQQCPEFILCDCTQGGHALQQCSSERVGPLPTNKGIPFLNTEPGYTEAG